MIAMTDIHRVAAEQREIREMARQLRELRRRDTVVIDHMTGARCDPRPDDDIIDQHMQPVRLFGSNVVPFRGRS